MAIHCVFARHRGSPLLAAHNHHACAWALEQRHHHWHPETVVFATRRLLTLAAAHPEIGCDNCPQQIEWVQAGHWEHIETGRHSCDNGNVREESTDAAPCPNCLLDLALQLVAEQGWVAIGPLLAVMVLEQWGPWHDSLPTAFATIEWFVTDKAGTDPAGDVLAPARAMLAQV